MPMESQVKFCSPQNIFLLFQVSNPGVLWALTFCPYLKDKFTQNWKKQNKKNAFIYLPQRKIKL